MRAYARKHDMLLGKESVLIAVSGGADSMALLEMVARLAPLLKLQIGIAHLDHELRGEESRKDATFVNEQARERGLKIFIGRAEVQRLAAEQKLSLEDAARKARYQFLERVARRHGYSTILTGHTADDNAETLLMNLLRGSGVTGLAGIPPVRSLGRGLILARPLLWAGRTEIREFVQQAGIQWREDESNQNTRFLRNRVRQELLPALQQFNPSIVNTLNSTAEIMRGVEQHLGHSVRTAIEQVTVTRNNEPRSNDSLELNLNHLKHLLPAIQSELVQRVVCQRFELPPIPHLAVERTIGLLWKETGSKAEIIDGISAIRDRETLIIRRDPPPFIPFERSFDLGTTVETGKARLITRRMGNTNIQFGNNRSVEFINADRLPKRLTLRSWREGDRFQPLGMDGEKKVSDFLIDEKTPLDAKRDILVLTDGQEIIWVCGMRLDERYRITPETKNVLRLEFIQPRRQQEQAKQAPSQQQPNGQQNSNGQKPQQQSGQQAKSGQQQQQQRAKQGSQQPSAAQQQPKQQPGQQPKQQAQPAKPQQQSGGQQQSAQQPKPQQGTGKGTSQPNQKQQPQQTEGKGTQQPNQQQRQQQQSKQQPVGKQQQPIQPSRPQPQGQRPQQQQQQRQATSGGEPRPQQGQQPARTQQPQPKQQQQRQVTSGGEAHPQQGQQQQPKPQTAQPKPQQQPSGQQSQQRPPQPSQQRSGQQQQPSNRPRPMQQQQPPQQPRPHDSAKPQQPAPAPTKPPEHRPANRPAMQAQPHAKPVRPVPGTPVQPAANRPAQDSTPTAAPSAAKVAAVAKPPAATASKKKAAVAKAPASTPAAAAKTDSVGGGAQQGKAMAAKRPATAAKQQAPATPTSQPSGTAAAPAKPKRAPARKTAAPKPPANPGSASEGDRGSDG